MPTDTISFWQKPWNFSRSSTELGTGPYDGLTWTNQQTYTRGAMKFARMLTLFAMVGVLEGSLGGCGGGGGSSSSSTSHYVGNYTRSDGPSGTADFTIASGGRMTASLLENGTGKTGIAAGRIVQKEINGSIDMQGSPAMGFQGSIQQGFDGKLTMHITFAGSSSTADFSLNPG